MNKSVIIDTHNDYYILSGDISLILKNRRYLSVFKGLFKIDILDDKILIFFKEKESTKIYSELKIFLNRFDFRIQISDTIKKKESILIREQDNFAIFSQKAKKIRNNNFLDSDELIEDFKNFKKFLEDNMKRTLYPLQILSAFHMAFAQNSCNFAVPGAGKTSIVYGAYAYLKQLSTDNPKYIDKLLVIGPLSSFAPWENEYRDCFGVEINSQRLSGDSSINRRHKEQHLYSSKPKNLTLISHAGVPLLEKEIIDFLKQNKTMVVIDEAHRIKNVKGVWGQSVVEIAKEATSIQDRYKYI